MFQWLRSLIFTVQMYLMMAVIGIGTLPLALWKQKYVYLTVQTYCRWVMWTAGWMVGLKTEFRGKPHRRGLVAAKHQSFLDVLMIASQIPTAQIYREIFIKTCACFGVVWETDRIGAR